MVATACTSYRHQIDEASNLHPLLKGLHRKGVSDAVFDTGFRQINYLKPGEWGEREGAGDCFIDEREFREYLYDNWREFRTELTKLDGEALPWDKDNTPFHNEKPEEGLFVDRAKEVAGIVEADLKKWGLKKTATSGEGQ